MASVPFAEVDALAAWLGVTIDNEERAEAILMAASYLVQNEVGASVSDEWTEVPGIVGAVVVQVAARVWHNPQGLVSESIDDYTRRYGNETPSGVFLTQQERDMLSPYRAKPRGLWNLSTTRGNDYEDQYLVVVGQDEPMPFLLAGE